jgi:hypothetical protein
MLLSFPLDYPGVGNLDHTVALFCEELPYFSTVAVLIYIPTNNIKVFLHILTSI